MKSENTSFHRLSLLYIKTLTADLNQLMIKICFSILNQSLLDLKNSFKRTLPNV